MTAPAPKSSFRRKVVVSTLLGVLALGGGLAVYRGLAALRQAPQPRQQPERSYQVDVFEAERCNLREMIAAFGAAQADRKVVLSAQVSGEIVEVHPDLEVGRKVEPPHAVTDSSGQSRRLAGDLLVQIDPEPYQERVVQAKHQLAENEAELKQLEQEMENTARLLETARKNYELMKQEYNRMKQLRQTEAASQSQMIRTRLELKQYKQTVLQHENTQKVLPLRKRQVERSIRAQQSKLKVAQLDLENTAVRPPFAGILEEVMVEKGQYVRAGDPLVQLVDLAVLEVPLPVRQSDYATIKRKVQAGQKPAVTFAENETAPGQWHGRIVRVAANVDESTRTVKVFARVVNSRQEVPLLPGTFVHARIQGPVLNEVIAVPRDSLVENRLRIATESGRVEVRSVQIRRRLSSLAIIESGLQPGEQVILSNLEELDEGTRVEPQQHHTLDEELNRHPTKAGLRKLASQADQPEPSKVN